MSNQRPSSRNLLCLVGGSSLLMSGCSSWSIAPQSSSPTTAAAVAAASARERRLSVARVRHPLSIRTSALSSTPSPHQQKTEDPKHGTAPLMMPPPEQKQQQAAMNPPTVDKKFVTFTRNPFRWAVLRLGVTELRGTSPYNYGSPHNRHYEDGTFACGYCGNPLFDGTAKYESGSGWPSFWRSARDGAVQYQRELDGRLECQCGKCGSHLGHVFLDGPLPETVERDLLESSPTSDPRGKSTRYLPRFCINGAAMDFQKKT